MRKRYLVFFAETLLVGSIATVLTVLVKAPDRKLLVIDESGSLEVSMVVQGVLR